MKRLSISLKILCLGSLLSNSSSVYAKEACALKDSLWEIMHGCMHLWHKATGCGAQAENKKINEEILIETFSKIGPGELPNYPELMDKLFSHMFYTEDLQARNNPFVRHLLAYYTLGSAAYEKLTQWQVDFLKHLQIMEEIYHRPMDGSKDESDDQGYSPKLEQGAKDEEQGDYLFVVNYPG